MVINKELQTEAKNKIADRRPEFVRQESWRYDCLVLENWRKPEGKITRLEKQVSGGTANRQDWLQRTKKSKRSSSIRLAQDTTSFSI